ncbi:hypothetical protein QTG54_001642 [Skeletonema marinoi]|uniref:DUF7495 domain-containing protein n=2 Tax=Skeletonema marinoi TaxID=267567 RepID=A0AAD8YLF3_9STRA|nr:hypothetical protein QTG54_001642 [Skeletonema marinoi]
MPFDPPPTSYSDKVGYRDNVDDIEALASRALSPISDFPPCDSYDATEDDHSITSSDDDDDDDDDDMTLSDEEGQRNVAALRQKTSDILKEFEDFAQDVNESSTTSREIMNTLTGNNNTINRGEETVKSRIAAGGGDAVLNRDWSRNDRNLHDVGFGSDDDSMGGYNKYEKRGFFKYAVPFFHSKKFKFIAAGVAVAFLLVLIVGSMTSTGGRGEVGDLGDVVMVEDLEDEARKPEDFIVSIDTSTCEDNPTAIITTDGHTCEDFIAHVGRENLHKARCSHESPMKNEKGETLLVKDVCRLSCGVCEMHGRPEASAIISIDTSTCEDNPTAIITTDGHTCEDFIAHVGRENLHKARCSHESPMKNEKGETLLVKDVCRLSCGVCGDAWTGEQQDSGVPQAQTESLEPATQQAVAQEPQEEMTNWMTPVTLNNDSSSPVTSSADCKDDLTKVVAIGGKNCETYFSDSTLVHLQELRCSHQTDIEDDSGNVMFVKDICKKSCGLCGDQSNQGTMSTFQEAPKPEATQPDVPQPEAPQPEAPQPEAPQPAATQPAATQPQASQPQAPPPQESATISIDTSTCEDNPTATITTDGHTCEDFIAHVGRVPLHNTRCSHESPVKNEKGETLLVKDVCRLSCGVCGDAWTGAQQQEPQAAEATPVESVSSPASTTTVETTPVESVSSPSIQQSQESSSTATTASVFTREEGWEGFSSSAAIDFCGGKGLSLCSYEAVCPLGEGNPPFVMTTHFTWVPISDGSDWVAIGEQRSCEQWSKTHEESPPWANAGEAIEEITRTVYCCESDNPARNAEIPTEDTVSNTIEDSGSIQSIPASTSGLSEQQAYNYVGKTYAPVWFDRSSGWEGTTYEAAVQFCLSLEQNVNLCPYEAYCPMGPRTTTPFGGLRDDDGSWAPAINSREWWVQVGGTDNVCKHADLDPNWGQDGSNEELTRHILCCKYVN